MNKKYNLCMQDKFTRFSFFILLLGIIAVVFTVLSGILHTSLSTKIQNKPSDMMGPNAKF